MIRSAVNQNKPAYLTYFRSDMHMDVQ